MSLCMTLLSLNAIRGKIMAWHDALSKKHQTRRPNKYGAVKVKDGKNTYDSKGEAEMHGTLKLMEKAGLIKDIVHHPAAVSITRFVKYKPDFIYFEIKRQTFVYVDFKGVMGERFSVICNLWKEFGVLPLQIWKKNGNRMYLHKEIIGK